MAACGLGIELYQGLGLLHVVHMIPQVKKSGVMMSDEFWACPFAFQVRHSPLKFVGVELSGLESSLESLDACLVGHPATNKYGFRKDSPYVVLNAACDFYVFTLPWVMSIWNGKIAR